MYLIFAFDFYYPSGGRGDCIGRFDSVADGVDVFKRCPREFLEIYSIHENEWFYAESDDGYLTWTLTPSKDEAA